MLKTLKYWLLLVIFASATAQQSDDSVTLIKDSEFADETLCIDTDNIQNQDGSNHALTEKYKDLFKELFTDIAQIETLELIVFSIATIIHELGHAAAAKSLFEVRDPIQIHIGTRTPETTPQLFSLGNMHFYKTIPWVRGLTGFRYKKHGQAALQKTCLGFFTVAGGLSAAVFMYVLLAAIAAYCAHCDNKGLFEISLKSFINGSSPFSYILNTKALSCKQKRFLLNAVLVICLTLIYHIFYGCTPYCNSGDGITIWKEYIGITGTPLKIVQGLSVLGVWGCWALLIKKYYDARKKLSPEAPQISLPVALISLLLMYNQLIPN
jgi:hypothetical protein